MDNLLRDPVWNGITGIISIVALIIALRREDVDVMSLGLRFFLVLCRAMVGVLVLSPGQLLQRILVIIFAGGIPMVIEWWQYTSSNGLWPLRLGNSLVYAIFPGLVSSLIASTGRTFKISAQRAVISVIVTLILADAFLVISGYGGPISFDVVVSDLLSDIFGGVVVGLIIAFLVTIVNSAFEQQILGKDDQGS